MFVNFRICLRSCIEALDGANKREMIMPEKSSIGFSGFEKLIFLVKISKFYKIPKISKIFEGGAPALRVIRAGTRLTVHRSLP